MTTFPILKTNAVAQYPTSRELVFRNQVLRFLDGSEQRYRDSAGPLHRWMVRLERLDQGEVAALQRFFEDCQGRLGDFAFVDPWDGTVYPCCSLEADDLDVEWMEEMNGRASLTVIENRG